jgi:tRNA(Arg) A34 adenosine deaminase TadA
MNKECKSMSEHEHYMRRAIELGQKALQMPFGAVVVDKDSGEIVAEGRNRSLENPIWHGEIDALNRLALAWPGFKGTQLLLYSTAEPCPMCQSAILWAGIGSVIYGSSIRFLQSRGWWQIDIVAEEVVRRSSFRQCTLIGGVLEQECNALFETPPQHYRVEPK